VRGLRDRLLSLLRTVRRVESHAPGRGRGACVHVVILDGTMSSLEEGAETNAGLIHKLLCDLPASDRVFVYYEAGVQWRAWGHTFDVAMGRGINRQIRRAYGWLASHYRPGDRIFLFGYSRGAFAVRSLAGLIDRVGLLTAEAATERNVTLAYRHYRSARPRPAQAAFVRAFCHASVEVEMIGVFDTVKALGLRLPLLWLLTETQHSFHNFRLGPMIRSGFHALALDETRSVYEPVLWDRTAEGRTEVEQVWFRGTHGDVGGQLGGFAPARPLANIPLLWMLERAAARGLPLPDGWRDRYRTDPLAPNVGTWRGLGALFLFRAPRIAGRDGSESLHPTALIARDRPPRARFGPVLGGAPRRPA